MADSPKDSQLDSALQTLEERYTISADCTEDEFLAVCRLYARDIVDLYELTVDVAELSWETSTRAKRRAGAVKYKDGTPLSVILTWGFFESQGWKEMAETIRHELIHVHLLNEESDPGHGDRFRELASRLDTTTHCERFTEPKYWVVCDDCGNRLARYRRSKVVKNPEKYACKSCDGTLRVRET